MSTVQHDDFATEAKYTFFARPLPQVLHLESFHLFPQPPIEIQREIWGQVCCVSRVIDLSVWEYHPHRGHGPNYHHLAKAWEICQPAILHACHEARLVGLKHYDLEVGPSRQVKLKSPFYVNWDYDVICLAGDPKNHPRLVRPRQEFALLALVRYFLQEKNILSRPLRRVAFCAGFVQGPVLAAGFSHQYLDELCSMLAEKDGLEVIVYERNYENWYYQLDPVPECEQGEDKAIESPSDQNLRRLYALLFTSIVPPYPRKIREASGATNKDEAFRETQKAIEMLKEAVGKIRDLKPELKNVQLPGFKAMALVSCGGAGVLSTERRLTKLAKASL